MFKCCECGAEYKVKPDYCECGNDSFEEIIESVPSENVNHETNINHGINVRNSEQKIHYQKELIKDNFAPKPADILSVAVFIVCLAISVAVFYFGNDETSADKFKTPQAENKVVQNIPEIDSFWDNTPPKMPVTQEKVTAPETKDAMTIRFEQWLNKPRVVTDDSNIPVKTQVSAKPVQKSVQQVQKQVSQVQTPQQKTAVPVKNTTQTTQKQVQTPQKQTENNSAKDLLVRVQKNAQNSVNNSKPAPVATVNNSVQTQKTQQKQAVQTFQTIHTQPVSQQQVQPKPELRNNQYVQIKTQAQIARELSEYKASLRNTIGKKINFANVVGDGNCAITFKISSAGKLTDRAFSQQSSNITLNDAVYSAMKSTPSFNPPPEGYKNGILTLKVKIYNGNFEISLN